LNEVYFCFEDTPFILSSQALHIDWIFNFLKDHNRKCGTLTYIFCSDTYLLAMNKEHLNHDYFTDIITFNYVQDEVVNGDIFISIDRVKDNSKKFQCSFAEELRRVMAHGVLHLIGFNDKSKLDQEQMRNEENRCLNLYNTLK
jgi:rRNA maturation RNase YbeY